MPRWLAVAVFLCAAPLGCSREPAPAAAPPPPDVPAAVPRAAAHSPVQAEMKHVRLIVADGIVLEVDTLRGEMVSRTSEPLVFDDPASYILRVGTANTSMDMVSLTNLMNHYVFAYAGAPISDLEVRATKDGRLEESGKLHKGVAVPFSMTASVSATPDGRLRLHVESVKVLGLPSKGLMDLFGLEMEGVVDLKNRRGLEIDGNDIVIAIGQVLPPPEVQGRLSRVAVEGDRLVQTFAPASDRPALGPLSPPDKRAQNYLYFSGSDIRFGKLLMTGADLQLIDADPRDPFDFFSTKYLTQLVAGYSKTTASGGLAAYLPDYADVIAKTSQKPAGK